MKQGRASRNVYEGFAHGNRTKPTSHRILVAGVAQYGQAAGNHITDKGSTGYHGLDAHIGSEVNLAPQGPAPMSGVGGGRRMLRSGSQGRH
jgi:hypothetical protein